MSLSFLILGAALAAGGALLMRRFTGFAAQKPADYATALPPFDIREVFSGPVLCEGVIFGPTGRVASRFTAEMNPVWQGDTCRMTEDFVYDSGATQAREWTLTLLPDGAIRAEAPDLAGTGGGRQQGGAAHLRYRLRLPQDAGGHVLDVVDWMYLAPNGTVVNRSQMRKFGFKVAELVATMRKVPA
ncbi:DUF3833 family protein [Phaeovulum vinaykumarii]|uniref:DUF3833 domain-containing protein n=1 Tax=Phaeovulum vinaykumarii TaxID=407234 RepID=A0A1N7KYP4_9RHOB|nr:Protein of unknown function [Phaeovulum vinaykumarii]SOC00980.1 uncharacterized protein DUF3833 [Phaeovulum vinaykumarii]